MAFAADELHDRVQWRLADIGETVVDQRGGDTGIELDGGGEELAGDEAHALGRGDGVGGGDEMTAGLGEGCDTTGAAAELHHVVEQVAADVHQAVAAVVPLAVALDVMQL